MADNLRGQARRTAYLHRRLPDYKVLPNPKAKLLDQVREIMRLRHYSIRTEQAH